MDDIVDRLRAGCRCEPSDDDSLCDPCEAAYEIERLSIKVTHLTLKVMFPDSKFSKMFGSDDRETPQPLSGNDLVKQLSYYLTTEVRIPNKLIIAVIEEIERLCQEQDDILHAINLMIEGSSKSKMQEIERLRNELADWQRTVRAHESLADEEDKDIVDDLLAFAEIIDSCKGVARVEMLEGSIFKEAAEEIMRLRHVKPL
jgi:hypothetical protein